MTRTPSLDVADVYARRAAHADGAQQESAILAETRPRTFGQLATRVYGGGRDAGTELLIATTERGGTR